MATRVVEGKKPYTGGKAIDVNEDKVISLKLRDENNLIIYDEGDDEIYVDLQLDDELEPTDAFPVGVNTGRVIVDNGWDKTGTIIIAKTTSGDYIQLLYADDGTLWMDNGTGTFKQILFKGDIDTIVTNLTNYIDLELDKKQDLTVVDSTAPADPTEGLLWYDTSSNTLYIYDGTTWQSTGSGGGGGSTIEYKTQAEYNALPSSKLTDGKHYFIFSGTPVTGVTLNESQISLAEVGDTYQLTATVIPNDAYDTSVTWSSDDTSIATVSQSGLVTCVTPGTCTITVTTTDGGFTATCGVDSGGWTPGANTVVYYPLTEDLLDYSGNSYNLTAVDGNNYSFTTNSQGLECINLNPGNTNTYFQSSPTIDFSSNDYTFVCKICDVLTSYPSSWAGTEIFSIANNFKGPLISMGSQDQASDLGTTIGNREIPTGQSSTEGPKVKTPLTGSNFVTFIGVRDHTALTMTSYFDGVYNWKGTYNLAPSSYQGLTLFRDTYDNGAGRFLHGKMRDVIIEDKAWTLQEIQNFSS